MLLIVLTNWLWIPAILYYDVAVSRGLRLRQGSSIGG